MQVRLPDRSEVVDNNSLRQGARAIVDEVMGAIWREVEPRLRAFPDRFSIFELREVAQDMPRFMYDLALMQRVLEARGWHEVVTTDYDSLNIYHDGESLNVEAGGTTCFYDRKALPVRSRMMAQSLSQAGVAAFYAPGDWRVTWKVEGLRKDKSPYISVAESLAVLVDGQPLEKDDTGEPLNLRCLVVDETYADCDLLEVQTPVLWVGAVKDLVAEIGRHSDVGNVIVNAVAVWNEHHDSEGMNWEWYTDEQGDWELGSEVESDLILQVTEAFEPRLRRVRALYFQLREVVQALEDAERALSKALRCARGLEDTTTPEPKKLTALLRQVGAQRSSAQRAMKEIAAAVGHKA